MGNGENVREVAEFVADDVFDYIPRLSREILGVGDLPLHALALHEDGYSVEHILA